MALKDIIEKVLEFNPEFERDNLIVRTDGRIEYNCKHSCGHTVYSPNKDYIHGCDGCCKNYNVVLPKDLNSQ
jgi:hypothetical protein